MISLSWGVMMTRVSPMLLINRDNSQQNISPIVLTQTKTTVQNVCTVYILPISHVHGKNPNFINIQMLVA